MAEELVRSRHAEDGKDYVIGYMCLIDFEHEIGAASGGNRVFPSVEDLRDHHKCADDCGIVEVEIRARRIVQPGTGK